MSNVELKIVLNIGGDGDFRVTTEEARELYSQLHVLFGAPLGVMYPTYQPLYDFGKVTCSNKT